MSLSDAVVVEAPSATQHLTFRLDRSSQFIVARLIRFWVSRDIKKNSEFIGITLLLLDKKRGFSTTNDCNFWPHDQLSSNQLNTALSQTKVFNHDSFGVYKLGWISFSSYVEAVEN